MVQTLEKSVPENCQTCLRPFSEEGSPSVTQWISVCRCAKTYAPNAQYSIDICETCKRRVVANATQKINRNDLCSCENPKPKTVPNFIKQNTAEPVELDLAQVGMSPETFPIERYKPLAILGQGARANVVLARDKSTGKKVAVKCFKRITPEITASFTQEAKKVSKLSHTNIARLIDFNIYNNVTPYLVTEYKDGFNLEHYLAAFGTPSHDVAVMILMSVCEALLYAQKESLFHRDIRPGNIIFVDDMNAAPSVIVTDFSLPKIKAKEELTEPVDALYMSSDEARNMEFDEKSEVYSIGCVGFALMTGRPPFLDGTARDIKNSHALKLPPRISNLNFDTDRPKDLEEVIERCLEKDPNVRFESVAKLNERLEVFPRRVQMKIAAILAERRKKKILTFSAAGLGVALILSMIGYFVLHAHP